MIRKKEIVNLKILLSSISLLDAPNGIFLRSFFMARELSENGNDVTLMVTQQKGCKFPFVKLKRDGVTIIAVPSLVPLKIRKFGYDFTQNIVRILYVIREEFQIVDSDSHRPAASIPCIIHRKLRGSKYIAEWWDYFGRSGQYENKQLLFKLTIGKIDNFLEKYTVKIADGVVVLAKLLKQRALALGQPGSRIETVWGGSDIRGIQFYESPETNRANFKIEKNKIIFMTAGVDTTQLYQYKTFIEALNILYKKRDDFLFVITGRPIPDCIKRNLKIGGYFREVGFVPYKDYGCLLSSANYFVVLQEDNNKNRGRWPNCIGDYLAAGRPIICNRVGEVHVAMDLHCDVFIEIELNELEAIKSCIEKILDNKPNGSHEYKKIRGFATNTFTWKHRATQLEHFFNIIKH